MMITNIHVQRFRLLVRIGMGVVLFLLMLAQVVTQYTFREILGDKQLVLLLNTREQHTTELLQRVVDYQTSPDATTWQRLEQKESTWDQENTLLVSHLSSYTPEVQEEIAATAAAAHGILDEINHILSHPRTTPSSPPNPTSTPALITLTGRYNSLMAQAENNILLQNIDEIYTAVVTNIALLVLILLVFLAEYFSAYRPALQAMREQAREQQLTAASGKEEE